MEPTKTGQIVKFHTPLEYEDPKQLFIVFEFIEDGARSKTKIRPIDERASIFNAIHLIRAKDLEVVENHSFNIDEVLKQSNNNLSNFLSLLS
ncbi:hypothetical protein [Polaribacter aestuariivivens]|uniref:hypothetical protein n=1 Tax=Polaribacter aestuariivivens TaxID=2304626 RepID=UPI003F49A3C9